MTRPPANASEWTTAVEAAVQTELLRRSRRLKWAVVLSLLVGALAVGLAISLRGMTWEEIERRVVQATEPVVQQRLAPVLNTQITQGQVQLDLQAELGRLEAEIAQLRNEVLARRNAVDPQVTASPMALDDGPTCAIDDAPLAFAQNAVEVETATRAVSVERR